MDWSAVVQGHGSERAYRGCAQSVEQTVAVIDVHHGCGGHLLPDPERRLLATVEQIFKWLLLDVGLVRSDDGELFGGRAYDGHDGVRGRIHHELHAFEEMPPMTRASATSVIAHFSKSTELPQIAGKPPFDLKLFDERFQRGLIGDEVDSPGWRQESRH